MAMPGDVLTMWSVYDHPSDYPDAFVARKFEARGGITVATSDMFTAPTLNELRRLLPPGLVCFPRNPDDDPVIVETWL